MLFIKKLKWFSWVVMACLLAAQGYAAEKGQHYYRSFWNPEYHAKPLDYCLIDKKHCGQAVADAYCHSMGYDKAFTFKIAYNIGVTNYLNHCVGCKGWNCNGFKRIMCESEHRHKPARPYVFRSRTFVYPRFNHYRIAWCYEGSKGCGQRAAFSFCRRMGYAKAQDFKEATVAATRALGDQRLCFGETCRGFSKITCYR